jgi:carbamoyl-phosphate synthase large subunit
MPYLFVLCGLDEPLPPIPRRVNPLPPGLAWVRGMDILPILTTERRIEDDVAELARRRERVLGAGKPGGS